MSFTPDISTLAAAAAAGASSAGFAAQAAKESSIMTDNARANSFFII